MLLSGVRQVIDGGSLPSMRGENTLWTYAVKQWLASTALQHALKPIYTDRQSMSEFMLDLVWWKDGPGESAVLACEVEWGNTRDPLRNPDRVAEDFHKLLSFKAPFKLMIFDSYSKTAIQTAVIQELTKHLQQFGDHRRGEQYLVVDMSPMNCAWVCPVAKDGEDRSLRLDPLGLK